MACNNPVKEQRTEERNGQEFFGIIGHPYFLLSSATNAPMLVPSHNLISADILPLKISCWLFDNKIYASGCAYDCHYHVCFHLLIISKESSYYAFFSQQLLLDPT